MSDMIHHLVADQWLTEKVQRSTYRLIVDQTWIENQQSSGLARLKEIQNKPVFIYSKVPTAFMEGIRFLQQHNFNLVDTNVVLEKSTQGMKAAERSCLVRYAKPEDRGPVVELARNSFTYSRFHLDPAISREIADAIKADWVGNYFAGTRGDQMVIATVDEVVAGFVQLLHGDEGTLIIDLIAVGEKFRRQGIARDMIHFAESGMEGIQRIRVGTQIANTSPMRLYESLGFRVTESHYVFHYHHE